MLLRLLPVPSPSQPSPPTILFTLPLPASPYTSRALPLPPNLLAHRSLCLQEDVDCTNVLLGDKASWISGVVDNVTFSLPHQTIVVHLVDGSTQNVELSEECVNQLHRVVNEVQLSFAAAAAPPPTAPASPADTPRSSMSSDASSMSSFSSSSTGTTSRRSPSSLLYSLISPLLSSATPERPAVPAHVVAHQQPARAHRRQARSLLVDAYRRYVLPALKEQMPSAYLLWAIESETQAKMDEYAKLREVINALLAAAGVELAEDVGQPLRRVHSSGSSTTLSNPMSEGASPFSSPRTSVDEERTDGTTSPQNLLLAIPPAHALPIKLRSRYSAELARLTQLASRLGSITKLASRYEREEGKRRWLEQLDLQRDGDKACRRAFSNALLSRTATRNATPIRRSGLYQSVTAADLELASAAPLSPSLDLIIEGGSDVDSDIDVDSEPELSDDRSSGSSSPEPVPRTPTTDRDDALVFEVEFGHKGAMDETPALVPSHSDDSLSECDDWDEHMHERTHCRAGGPPVWDAKGLPPLPAPPTWHSIETY